MTEQEQVRRDKLHRLRAEGIDPYPVGYPRSTSHAQARALAPDLGPDVLTATEVGVTGRVVLKRGQGGIAFAALAEDGATLQVVLQADRLGAASLASWQTDVDLGDHVGVTGVLGTTRRGELSVFADAWALTSKALRPLPDKHHGLADPEARVRARHLDLIVRPEAREALLARATVLRALREALHEGGYVEAETPVLQTVHGGAAARPFRTHMNALDLPLSLRIATELHLKRLVVGGISRVYEIGKVFRNEGADSSHNPEFTMLEAYAAYSDYDDMAVQVRSWVLAVAAALGRTTLELGGRQVDLAQPWRSATLHGLVAEAVGEPVDAGTPVERLRAMAAERAVALQPGWSAGEVVVELFEQLVEDTLVEPTFVRDWPVEVRPLTRAHRADPRLTESWDLIVGGVELGTAYSELVDPVEERARLTDQSRRAAAGDDEAMALDEDFLRALEAGMPPTGGMGMGVDRLLMTLAGISSIREAVAFPLVRP